MLSSLIFPQHQIMRRETQMWWQQLWTSLKWGITQAWGMITYLLGTPQKSKNSKKLRTGEEEEATNATEQIISAACETEADRQQ
jgi:hypothetical protein